MRRQRARCSFFPQADRYPRGLTRRAACALGHRSLACALGYETGQTGAAIIPGTASKTRIHNDPNIFKRETRLGDGAGQNQLALAR